MSQVNNWKSNPDDWDNEDDWEENANAWDFDDDSVVTVKLAKEERCPECASEHVIQNFHDKYRFLCLDCFHEFRNS